MLFAVLASTFVAAASLVSAGRYHDDVDEASAAIWKELIEGGKLPPLLSEEDLRLILHNSLNREEKHEPPSLFTALSDSQKKFAVNPDFKSFYDASFRDLEGVANDEMDAGSEVEEPLMTSTTEDRHQNPKKASALPRSESVMSHQIEQERMNDIYFTTVVAVSSALAVFAIVGAGFCYHRVRRNSKASEDVEYPAYGITGPSGGGKETSPTSGTDRKLAQNAQMYHYQHQKQQMIAFDTASSGAPEKRGPNGTNGGNGALNGGGAGSDCESEDGEEGDYTVYECPGLAPAGEMEVHNPLFQDDPTPKAK